MDPAHCKINDILSSDSKYTERRVVQFQLISVYKLNESKRQKRAIEWREANMSWFSNKYAEAFGELYHDRIEDLDKFYGDLEIRANKIFLESKSPEIENQSQPA